MAGIVDTLLKGSISASLLIASASVAYYYLQYLPQRDAQIDHARQMEQVRLEFSRQAEQSRVLAEKRSLEEKQAAEREGIQVRYAACVQSAEVNYSSAWADQCKRTAERSQKQRAECVSKGMDKTSCEQIYTAGDPSASCSLPRVTGNDLNDQLKNAREQCLQESRVGLQ